MTERPQGTSGGQAGTGGEGNLALFLAMAAVSFVFALVNAVSDAADWVKVGHDEPGWHSYLYEFSSVALWVALAPALIALQQRWPFRPPWGSSLAIHAAMTAPVSLVHVLGMVAIREAGYALAYGGARSYDFFGDAPAMTLFYEWRKDVLTYAMLSGFIWAWRRFRSQTPPPAAASDAQPRIEIRDGARTLFLPAGEAYWIEAAGNYVEVHAAGQTHLVRGTLQGFEEKLAAAGFIRVHRSRLVNARRIRAVAGTEAGDFTITLDDGRTVGGSRRYRSALAPSPAP